MLANVHHRTVTITIITKCTQFTEPRYRPIVVKNRTFELWTMAAACWF